MPATSNISVNKTQK